MSTVIVFGGTGLLGASLVPALQHHGYRVLVQGRNGAVDICIDPSDRTAVFDALQTYKPSSVVNLVAETNVDKCELDPKVAWVANTRVVSNIAESIISLPHTGATKPHFIHISTDQVYDGPGPHLEKDICLSNVYSLSKFTGELLAERAGATILRSNFFGRSRSQKRQSFTDWLVKNLKEQTPITVFDDVIFSALHLNTLCDLIERCIMIKPTGIFNAGSRDSISKAAFAHELARALDIPTTYVSYGKAASAGLLARRPLDMSLQVDHLESTLAVRLPSIASQIKIAAEEYKSEQSPYRIR
jgi:dTDP-4-dehydrorhamnose reductase